MSTDYQTILDQTRAAAESAVAAAVKTKSDREAIESLVLEINEEQAVSIKNSKEAIRQAINAKGQSCSTSVPFEEYASKISAIIIDNSSSSGGMEFYKCASVDTDSKTWSGYKAVVDTDGVYSFEDTATDGLAYTENFPFPGSAYTKDLSVTVKELQSKDVSDISGGIVVGERYVFTEAQTLATGYFTYRKVNSGWSLMWHVVTHGWDRDYYHIIAVGLDASAVRMDASGYNYEPVSFSVDGDSRTWYYCKSQGVGVNDGFNPIFDGKPIDVGSNGEDYLAQAKELLNNYLAGTIIGETPDSPDNGGSSAPAQTFDPTTCSLCKAAASGLYPTCSVCGRAYCFNCIDMGLINVTNSQCDTCYKTVCAECMKTHTH